MHFDTVIHNASLVTMDAAIGTVASGWIGIRGDRIQAVERSTTALPKERAERFLDAQGGLVLPGLVNAHTHLPMTLFRGLADDLPLMTWLHEHILPAESRFIRTETAYWCTLLACAEMLLSGTTCCCDGYFLEDDVARAVSHAGLRAVLAQGIVDFPAPGIPDPAQTISHAAAFADSWLARSPLITPSVFCHAPYTCGPNTLKAAKAVADGRGLLFQIHAAETQVERVRSLQERGVGPVAFLDRLGVLDPKTLLAHCVWVDAAELDLLADRGCAVVHCPESNMKLGSGVAPVAAMRAKGVVVGLGTDGCASNNDLDLLLEMDTAAKLHKVTALDPTTLDAAAVLSMATLDGARAIGLSDRIGSLTVGKQADIIVLDTRAAHLTPLYHPVSQIVYAACGRDVRHVFIAGRQVVSERTLLTLDLKEVMDRVRGFAAAVTGKTAECEAAHRHLQGPVDRQVRGIRSPRPNRD